MGKTVPEPYPPKGKAFLPSQSPGAFLSHLKKEKHKVKEVRAPWHWIEKEGDARK